MSNFVAMLENKKKKINFLYFHIMKGEWKSNIIPLVTSLLQQDTSYNCQQPKVVHDNKIWEFQLQQEQQPKTINCTMNSTKSL
jgi:hypothetical protein